MKFMMDTNVTIRDLDAGDVQEVVDVLVESFFDYPVMRFVLGSKIKDYESKLRTLIHFFVMARVFRREIILGIGDKAGLHGAALISRPFEAVMAVELKDLRKQVWEKLGAAARERYEAFGDTCAQFSVRTPHINLNMVGVRPKNQGRGYGPRLIEHIQTLSHNDSASKGVTLNTETKTNVPFYEGLGYKLLGHAKVAPGLETWCFFRPDEMRIT